MSATLISRKATQADSNRNSPPVESVCGHEQLMGVAPRVICSHVQVLFHACAVLALHWCYSHSETAVNWTLKLSRFEREI